MKRLSILLLLAIFIITTCKDEPEEPQGNNKIELGNTTVDSVSYCIAVVTTNLIGTGSNQISQHGHCWSDNPEPTIDDPHTSLGSISNSKTFSSIIDNLDPKTKYYFRAYITYSHGVVYEEVEEFTTLALHEPFVRIIDVSNITYNSANCEGEVIDDGGSSITQRGICWHTNNNISLENCLGFSNEGTGLGNFICSITNISDNTTYFCVAYAINAQDTSYSDIINFATLDLTKPSITTEQVIYLNPNSAQGGGNVVNEGNGTVTARGICWNTTGNPTLENFQGKTINGIGIGNFTSILSSLMNNTTYFVTAYATNEEGTAYGEIISYFHCAGEIEYEGQIYETVNIGTQCWFKENLNIGMKINGGQEQSDNQTIEKYCYDDDEANCDTYGGLYQWNEMMQYTTIQGTQGICPDSWHIPKDSEWTALVDYLGGYSEAGGKLKEAGTIHWAAPNPASNSSGFTALPGGYSIGDGSFNSLGGYAYYWSSTEDGNEYARSWGLHYSSDDAYFGTNSKIMGFSIRCIHD